ncbi:polysaccharide biosynthesis C-terminal domain-containing protein [uncultured Fusobacterium sp.]|uniref:oligosaccharide flippase family protein n=1 Tax=uncultured Fusobacterium sp. TaxID=159267 RepID=UPI002588B0EC|nr:polysaccharide biosynthesis C-terminal domain-containing protein [uncultured Fusobacterium sp.]
MKKQDIKINFIYQILYNFIIMVIPLIITPILTRRLEGVEIGKFTYSRSIASYFVVFSMMGIIKYGQRVISQNIDNNIKLRKAFWSLFYVHIFFSIVGIIMYVLMCIFIIKNQKLFWIQGIYVASSLFDITWLYYGLENFKEVVIKNAFIKIIETALYILCIKSPDDIILYSFINCSSFFLCQLILIPKALKIVKVIHIEWHECYVHIKPIIFFAIAVIGISLYTVFDTTLLGVFSTNKNVAFYEYSNRIAKLPLAGASIIGTVLFPHVCKLVSQNNMFEQKKYMEFSIVIISLIGSASFWGLLIVGRPLAKLYLGEDFSECGPIIIALAPLVYIIGIGDIVRTQFMIPNKMDKEYIISILINAIVNIILSTVLIIKLPKDFQVYGAVVGTISAETIGMCYQLFLCRKFTSVNTILKIMTFSFFIGGIMYIILKFFTFNIEWDIKSLCMTVIIGAVIFSPMALLYIHFFKKYFDSKILEN